MRAGRRSTGERGYPSTHRQHRRRQQNTSRCLACVADTRCVKMVVLVEPCFATVGCALGPARALVAASCPLWCLSTIKRWLGVGMHDVQRGRFEDTPAGGCSIEGNYLGVRVSIPTEQKHVNRGVFAQGCGKFSGPISRQRGWCGCRTISCREALDKSSQWQPL